MSTWAWRAASLAAVLALVVPVAGEPGVDQLDQRIAASERVPTEWKDEWGAALVVYIIVFELCFGIALLATVALLVHGQTYRTLSFKMLVLYLNLVACTGRVIWLVDPTNVGRLYSRNVEQFLLRVPQVFWLTETLLFVVLWKRVYDAYKHAEIIRSRVTIGRYKYIVAVLSTILCGGGTMLSLLQALDVEPDTVQDILRGLFGLCFFGFLFGGVFYAIKLNISLRRRKAKEGKSGVSSDKNVNDARRKLRRTVSIWLVVGIVWAIAFLVAFSIGDLAAYQYLTYDATLRLCEAVFSFGGLSALLPTEVERVIWPCCAKEPPRSVSSRQSTRRASSARSSSRRSNKVRRATSGTPGFVPRDPKAPSVTENPLRRLSEEPRAGGAVVVAMVSGAGAGAEAGTAPGVRHSTSSVSEEGSLRQLTAADAVSKPAAVM